MGRHGGGARQGADPDKTLRPGTLGILGFIGEILSFYGPTIQVSNFFVIYLDDIWP